VNDNQRPIPDLDAREHVRGARDRIASLLNHDDELHLGMAIFDLWDAFDELVDPLSPPPPPRTVWIDDPAETLRATHAELTAAIDTSATSGEALSLGRAAHNVARALASVERTS